MAEGEMKFLLPIRTVSEANARENWRTRHSRRKRQRIDVELLLRGKLGAVKLPCVVTLTRVAPRALDKGDNCPGSLKAVRDEVAVILGVDDRDPRVEWRYSQRRGKPREYAVEVEIVPAKRDRRSEWRRGRCPGKVTQHWLKSAFMRIAAGEPEVAVLADYGYVPCGLVDDGGPRAEVRRAAST